MTYDYVDDSEFDDLDSELAMSEDEWIAKMLG